MGIRFVSLTETRYQSCQQQYFSPHRDAPFLKELFMITVHASNFSLYRMDALAGLVEGRRW
jgi:hypothetical protein